LRERRARENCRILLSHSKKRRSNISMP